MSKNLFTTARRSTLSRILPTRKVSVFAGRVFTATYGIRQAPNTRKRILGRLVDLQPVKEAGKVAGIRIQFRLCENGKTGEVLQHATDRAVKDLSLGPFDTVYQTPSSLVVKDSPDSAEIEYPIGNFENSFGMIAENRVPGSEHRFFRIAFMIES